LKVWPQPSDFDILLGWLSEREGKSVYIEVGTDDPDPNLEADSFPIAIRAVLGEIEPAHDTDHDRLAAMVRLPELQRSRIYLEPQRITRVERWGDAFKVWFHDSFYVGFSG
jgi:hypothetical protein